MRILMVVLALAVSACTMSETVKSDQKSDDLRREQNMPQINPAPLPNNVPIR